jgi:hypothetical protein
MAKPRCLKRTATGKCAKWSKKPTKTAKRTKKAKKAVQRCVPPVRVKGHTRKCPKR